MLIRYLGFVVLYFWLLPVYGISNCELSHQALYRANELANQKAPLSEQKSVLQEAVELCPTNAYAHNNFANLLGEEGTYPQAIHHYKQALYYRPGLSQAWYGLGEVYDKQKRFPLSLETYLQVCRLDADARQRIVQLLTGHRYTVTEEGEILDRESLLVIYDPQKRQAIQEQLAACGLRAPPRMTVTFRNFLFNTAEATLQDDRIE